MNGGLKSSVSTVNIQCSESLLNCNLIFILYVLFLFCFVLLVYMWVYPNLFLIISKTVELRKCVVLQRSILVIVTLNSDIPNSTQLKKLLSTE